MIYVIYLIILVLGLMFLFFPKDLQSSKPEIKIEKIIRHDCSSKKIKCIDSCDFLCTEDNYYCFNNVCQSKNSAKINCNKETGGVVVLTHFQFIPHWECLCTKPDIYGGPECAQKRDDVCQNGSFQFDLFKMNCICNKPNILINLNNKPYCVDAVYKNFFTNDLNFVQT